ncbi:MAG TPA: DUF493 domain-containing protein [Salinisphaeraceae bacterium]|nr:DUF493 domain-containing protein [Salinisphaeraceae bacterium]
MAKRSLLTFPCPFSIKAFGRQDPDLEAIVLDLVRTHVPALTAQDVSSKRSSNGRFVSLTIRITARSQAQLDAIYHDLSSHDAILMAL